jgi:hypothetical protein
MPTLGKLVRKARELRPGGRREKKGSNLFGARTYGWGIQKLAVSRGVIANKSSKLRLPGGRSIISNKKRIIGGENNAREETTSEIGYRGKRWRIGYYRITGSMPKLSIERKPKD